MRNRCTARGYTTYTTLRTKVYVCISLLAVLFLAFTCDPSYTTEVPDLTEESFTNLSLEEKFEIYKKVAGYLDTPDYVEESIAREGERAIPLIITYLESKPPGTKEIDALFLFNDIDESYFELSDTPAEEFLKRKIREEESSSEGDKITLDSYQYVLEQIRAERSATATPDQVLLTPGFGEIGPRYTEDADLAQYVAVIKEKIRTETGMTQDELDARFAITAYAKGEEKVYGGLPPLDNTTVRIMFVAKIDWVEEKEEISFPFIDVQGKRLSLEEIRRAIEVPFYFKITALKPQSEIERIVTAAHPKLKVVASTNNVRNNPVSKGITLDVFGAIDEEKNQCVEGSVNLVTGAMGDVREIACQVE